MENRITIEVRGGVAQKVYSTNDAGIEVDILYFDCGESKKEREELEDYLRSVDITQNRIY